MHPGALGISVVNKFIPNPNEFASQLKLRLFRKSVYIPGTSEYKLCCFVMAITRRVGFCLSINYKNIKAGYLLVLVRVRAFLNEGL